MEPDGPGPGIAKLMKERRLAKEAEAQAAESVPPSPPDTSEDPAPSTQSNYDPASHS